MGILNDLTNQVTDAVNELRDRSHRAAQVNRLRIVIRNERESSARAYVALGKYYYDHLRGQGSTEAEALCASIDDSDRRMKRAFDRLDEIREATVANVDESECTDCSDDCSVCKYHENDLTPEESSTEKAADASAPTVSAPAAPVPETYAPVSPTATPADEEAAPEEPEA